MNKKRFNAILVLVVLGFLLSACTGAAGSLNSWSGATISEDTVYYAGSSMVYALQATNGNIKWQYPEKASPARMFFAEPLLTGNQLIVGDYGKLLTSLNIADGTENWQFKGANGRYIDSPLLVDNLIIAPNADYSVYALDLEGNLKWTFTGGHAFWSKPVSDGTTVYIPCMDHYLYALDVKTGELKWKTDLGASFVARATLDEEAKTLYLGNLAGTFYAISADDGSIVWQQEVAGGVWAAPILHEGKLYFGDQKGNFNILNAADGKQDQFVQTDGAILGSGVLLDEGIIFANENGELLMIGFGGEKVWTRDVKGKLYANLQTNGDRLIVIANEGEKPLVSLDTNGNENWYFSTKK